MADKYEPVKLTKPQINKLNTALRDLEMIKEDLIRARDAGIPMTDEMITGCEQYKQEIEHLKAQFAKGQ